MVRNYCVRTDLALEEKERFESDDVEVSGVVLEEEYDEEREIRTTRVVIETENWENRWGRILRWKHRTWLCRMRAATWRSPVNCAVI